MLCCSRSLIAHDSGRVVEPTISTSTPTDDAATAITARFPLEETLKAIGVPDTNGFP